MIFEPFIPSSHIYYCLYIVSACDKVPIVMSFFVSETHVIFYEKYDITFANIRQQNKYLPHGQIIICKYREPFQADKTSSLLIGFAISILFLSNYYELTC